MNQFYEFFKNNDQRFIRKWEHYFEIYEKHFSKYKGKNVVFLEIGVFKGGSLLMWKDYFGPESKIIGIDIDPNCVAFNDRNTNIYIGSQTDKVFLENILSEVGCIDIVLDDGGHGVEQQKTSFEILFSKIADDGIYMCEDTMSSYWLKYGGGLKRNGTFIEFAKVKIDQLNAWHSEENNFKIDSFTKTLNSVHFYNSIIVFEKKIIKKPIEIFSGSKSDEIEIILSDKSINLHRKYLMFFLIIVNKILRLLKISSFILGTNFVANINKKMMQDKFKSKNE